MDKRAVGLVVKDNNIVLMHRFKDGREYWVFPGGGVEEGETTEEAMKREIQEELSLAVEESKLLFELYNEFTLGKYPPRQEYYYLVTKFSGEVKLGGEELKKMNEQDQYYPEWVALDEIQNMQNIMPVTAKRKFLEVLSSGALL